jgi:ADP-ribosylglycohydrolase
MTVMKIGRSEFRDKVYACWMGKNIGGTLGEKWECKRHTHALTFYDPMPSKASPNDDLDLQLVWLKMLEEKGVDPSVRTFADYWNRCLCRYPWNEYGFFMRNFSRGLMPPAAGCFENYFVDEMGSPIRSEIWACLHPGDPQAAARMAWKDSSLDHAGGEGTWGEMFWSAVQAAAFVESNPKTLIRIGLNMIPVSSHLGRSIREAVWCFENGQNWGEAREKIATRFGHLQACNAVPNHGFTIIGWLYGKDFGDCLCKAVNCGYDTDCTGATLGSVLGIINGTKGIPQKWIDPIGEGIVLHKFTGDCGAPKDITELTNRTIALAEKAMAVKTAITFDEKTALPADLQTRLSENAMAIAAAHQDSQAGVELIGATELWCHYGGEPVLYPGVGREIAFSSTQEHTPAVELTVPAGWSCTRRAPNRFLITCPGAVPPRNRITARIKAGEASFTILGPDEAKGFPAGVNVPNCRKCGARIEACICDAARK